MVSIPPWHSADKSALMLLIRQGERKERGEVKRITAREKDSKKTGGQTRRSAEMSDMFWERKVL